MTTFRCRREKKPERLGGRTGHTHLLLDLRANQQLRHHVHQQVHHADVQKDRHDEAPPLVGRRGGGEAVSADICYRAYASRRAIGSAPTFDSFLFSSPLTPLHRTPPCCACSGSFMRLLSRLVLRRRCTPALLPSCPRLLLSASPPLLISPPSSAYSPVPLSCYASSRLCFFLV